MTESWAIRVDIPDGATQEEEDRLVQAAIDRETERVTEAVMAPLKKIFG